MCFCSFLSFIPHLYVHWFHLHAICGLHFPDCKVKVAPLIALIFLGRESMGRSLRPLVNCWLTMDPRWRLCINTHTHTRAHPLGLFSVCNYKSENESGSWGSCVEKLLNQMDERWLMSVYVCLHTVFCTNLKCRRLLSGKDVVGKIIM